MRVRVQGQGTELGETPVVVALKADLPAGAYLLTPGAGPGLPAHVFRDAGTTYLGFVLGSVPATQPQTFDLEPARRADAAPGVELEASGPTSTSASAASPSPIPDRRRPQALLLPRDRPDRRRVHPGLPDGGGRGRGPRPPPPAVALVHPRQGQRRRLLGPSSQGARLDQGDLAPTVVGGPAVGLIRTTDDWLGPDGKKVCEDERVVRFYDTKTARVLDFDITLKATDGPVTFGDTKEGMFGLRVASSMDVDAQEGRQDHQRRGAHRRRGLGQGVALGRLHRAGRRQDGRRRHPQPPRQLPLPDDLARPRLRPVRRQPVRLARLRPEDVGRLHASRPASRSASATGSSSTRATPPRPTCRPRSGLRQAADGRDQGRVTVCTGSATPSSGWSWGSTGSSRPTGSRGRATRPGVGAESREQPVVMPRAPADPVATRVIREAGHRGPVDLSGSTAARSGRGSGMPSVPA